MSPLSTTITGRRFPIHTDREKLKDRLTELLDSPEYGCPFKYGSNYFYFHNTGLQAHSVLYMQKSLEDEAEILLDPNTWSHDGTVSLGTYAFSEDGEYLAYAVSQSGSDWNAIKVLRVGTKENESDELKNVNHTSIAWTHDSRGFFYSRYDGTVHCSCSIQYVYLIISTWANCDHANLVHVINLHQLPPGRLDGASVHTVSAPAGNDKKDASNENDETVVFKRDDEDGGNGGDGGPVRLPAITLRSRFDGMFSYVTNDGSAFTFHTNKDAPRGKVRGPLSQSHPLLSPPLQIRSLVDGSLLSTVPLRMGAVSSSSGRRSDSEAFFSFESFLSPRTVYRCDLTTPQPEPEVRACLANRFLDDFVPDSCMLHVPLPSPPQVYRQLTVPGFDPSLFEAQQKVFVPSTGRQALMAPRVCTFITFMLHAPLLSPPQVYRQLTVPGFDPSLFETQQVFVPSTDGTRIPMFVVCRKDLPRTADHFTLLYGYGGFNICIKPSFSVSRVLLMRHYGAVVAVANIRGGAEYGERWHKGGALGNKQQCFDDFYSCAEHLISEGYTSPSKLVIEGGSNGGLLVSAAVNQRPHLFACALAHVALTDMLRFHEFTIGHAWTSDRLPPLHHRPCVDLRVWLLQRPTPVQMAPQVCLPFASIQHHILFLSKSPSFHRVTIGRAWTSDDGCSNDIRASSQLARQVCLCIA
ncbi:unnamed protein product [Closterium sp. Yama58-4]|nr:unnamed protein product [Closterium sp. Yama58-4]